MNTLRRAWSRIHQPRVVSTIYFVQYLVLVGVGIYAIITPPSSIEGEVGAVAMILLAALLTLGGLLGAIAALPGIWWLERSAVTSIGLSAGLYLWIILTLHVTQPGNRLLQAGFVFYVLGMQAIRWVRVRERPYRPDWATSADV